MSFIPIDAKADIVDSKKGKLTPAQHAQLSAWCLVEKTGIFDCLGKCETTLLSYPVESGQSTIIFKSGYLVVCGRLVECEYGTKITLAGLSNGTSGSVYLQYNLGAVGQNEFAIKAGYKENFITDDLNENPINGIYEFELYKYEVQGGELKLKRDLKYIPNFKEKFKQFENSLFADGKPLGNYNVDKGTIEERLTSLGFKLPVFTNVSGTVNTGYGGYSEGNITFLKIPVKSSVLSSIYDSIDVDLFNVENVNPLSNPIKFSKGRTTLSFDGTKLNLKISKPSSGTIEVSLGNVYIFYSKSSTNKQNDFNVIICDNYNET